MPTEPNILDAIYIGRMDSRFCELGVDEAEFRSSPQLFKILPMTRVGLSRSSPITCDPILKLRLEEILYDQFGINAKDFF
jgi:hypothetical protein